MVSVPVQTSKQCGIPIAIHPKQTNSHNTVETPDPVFKAAVVAWALAPPKNYGNGLVGSGGLRLPAKLPLEECRAV